MNLFDLISEEKQIWLIKEHQLLWKKLTKQRNNFETGAQETTGNNSRLNLKFEVVHKWKRTVN